ncbi:hypothetical protein T484DRAFT_1631734 [Baffinella frigidus]|nr:hypothetical protein T484DRAFT_1631734 [Cryptophyta sp. CCMP2293]
MQEEEKTGAHGEDGQASAADRQAAESETAVLPIGLVECPICLALLCEPVTTPCGHSFCRTCLVSTLRRNMKKCPSCRSVCHIQPETHAENIALASVARTCFPKTYELRQAEVAAEKEQWDTILPIFYYTDTLFPSSPLTLHLFEPRYKVMMRRIVEASRKFAYLPNFNAYQARPAPSTTLHPAPYTLHPTPYILHPAPCTYTLHLTPYTLHLYPKPCILHPTLSTLHTTYYTLNPKP